MKGYKNNIIKFNDMPSETGRPNGSMIGGVGLSISSKCKNPDLAAEFIMMTTSADYQAGAFAMTNGQPGHRKAWTDDAVNKHTSNFYVDTLETMDFGSMRPRFNGYIDFQAEAGTRIRKFMMDGREDFAAFIEELNALFFSHYEKR